MNQKRGHYRIEIHEIVTANQVFNEKIKSIKDKNVYEIVKKLGPDFGITLLDLSAGGLHGTGYMELYKDDEVQIQIQISEEETILITGFLRNVEKNNKEGEFVYRIQFDKLKLKEEQAVTKYVNHLQSDIMKVKALEAYDKGETIPISEKIRRGLGERREKKDFMTKLPSALSFINWINSLLIIIFIISSRPLAKDPIASLLGNQTKHEWDLVILKKAYYLSLFLTIISFVSMIIDLSRQNRKGDYKHKSLLIQFSIGLVLTLVFILSLGIGQRGLYK